MPNRWTTKEEENYRKEIVELYEIQNLSLGEVAIALNLKESTLYARMGRLGIRCTPDKKPRHNNKKQNIVLPKYSVLLAEFMGIMLGDGHLSPFQATVTLGTKELPYVEYVASLMEHLFNTPATINVRKDGYRNVYIGSVELTRWLQKEGLVYNKVASQVDVPSWIFERKEWKVAFLKGFFDTDGSVYKLKFGIQISLTNMSLPMLVSLRRILIELEYKPSEISAGVVVYLTRRKDVERFFREIKPANTKHQQRFENFSCVGR
ncbi:MAG: hypothetical protein JWN64_157 [Parcubacteria group bacterium]|nr:hypothetical protein [Parcubacteria group bacterium]